MTPAQISERENAHVQYVKKQRSAPDAPQYERLRLAAKPEGINLPENLGELRLYLEKIGIRQAA